MSSGFIKSAPPNALTSGMKWSIKSSVLILLLGTGVDEGEGVALVVIFCFGFGSASSSVDGGSESGSVLTVVLCNKKTHC